MEKPNAEDGQLFIKNLASFVRTHEKALANALQLRRQSNAAAPQSPTASSASSGFSSSLTLASALSFGALKFTSENIKPAKLTLTPHHLFYLLSRFEELSIAVGPMNVRLENIQTEVSQSYVSFLNKPQRSKGDRDSIHSISSVRSVMSGMSGLWSSFGLGSKDTPSKSEKAKVALEADMKYLYSAFTKIPCLRLAPDHRARLISGYEEFPFDTAVPLHSFKNLSALEIIDIDYRSFFGWDRLSEQLRTLSIKRAHLDDPADLLIRIVLDDIDKRRRRSGKSPHQHSPPIGWTNNASQPMLGSHSSISAPGSPVQDTALGSSTSPGSVPMMRAGSEGTTIRNRADSSSPTRPTTKHSQRHSRGQSSRIHRTGSGSSNSSDNSGGYQRSGSSANLASGLLSPSKWRFLRHLGLPENSLTTISASSLAPVANTLNSLDLSANLLTEIPDSLSSLMALRALNLSHCMIEALHSLTRSPLPAITALNLRGNRLRSLAGIERLLSLERLDLRDNNIMDPTEMARLTCLPEIREIWVAGNPFVKTHPNYRVVIMNLFRRTPGYSEDLIIDCRGPGFTERKQLIDRVAEPESAPVVRPTVVDQSAVVHKAANPGIIQGIPLLKPTENDQETAKATARNENEGTNRRSKKSPRRRIVDMSPQPNPFTTDGLRGGPMTSMVSTQKVLNPNQPTLAPPFEQSSKSDSIVPSASSVHSPVKTAPRSSPGLQPVPLASGRDWSLDEELCRQQLKALRQDVGQNWISALGDRSWDGSPKQHPTRLTGGLDHPAIQNPPLARPPSHAILSGGQILG